MILGLILAALLFAGFSGVTFVAAGARDEDGPSGMSMLAGACILMFFQAGIWLLIGLRIAGGAP